MDFTKIFGRSVSTPGGEDTDQGPEGLVKLGAHVATLESSLKAEQDKSAALAASLETANKALGASTDALREEAKKAAVVASGPTTPATEAEHIFLAACSDPAQLSACIARYRAATPAALSGASAGQRETTATGEAEKPKAGADAARLANIESEREAGKKAAAIRAQRRERLHGGSR